MRAKYETPHAVVEIHGYDAPWRESRYVSKSGSAPVWERHMADGPTDLSESHVIYGGYRPECSFCWLGTPHTKALHASRIGARCIGDDDGS